MKKKTNYKELYEELRNKLVICRLRSTNEHYEHMYDKVPKVLSEMNIDLKTKIKLQRQAKIWIKHIKKHVESMKHPHPYDGIYHTAEISFIEVFFFEEPKKKEKRKK